ncbi:MAG: tRNA threonylcarbamoyladenosine dehydratase [Treponema sp.]|nr:tRNA threonylcarbamoyladenosine dehydratase [Treponema sp.]
MESEFSRLKLMIGDKGLSVLKKSKVLVFGVGGVGGYAVEALARSGVGQIDIVDNDTVSISNINRQIIALHSTIGKPKVQVCRERILDINPECKVNAVKTFFLPESASQFDFGSYDYVIDCIDTISAKVQIALMAQNSNTRVISSMGAGNKLNPLEFEVTDIYKTSVCPLARVMRGLLKKAGVKKLKVGALGR